MPEVAFSPWRPLVGCPLIVGITVVEEPISEKVVNFTLKVSELVFVFLIKFFYFEKNHSDAAGAPYKLKGVGKKVKEYLLEPLLVEKDAEVGRETKVLSLEVDVLCL